MKIIKVASSQGSLGNNKGCEKAPGSLIEELSRCTMDETARNPPFTIDSVKVVDNSFEETNKKIYEKIKSVNEPAIILGGDHSITLSAFKAFAENNQNAGLIVFDAHPDCLDNLEPSTHEDLIRGIIDNGICKKENVILIGIREWSQQEIDYVRKENIKYYSMKEIFEESIQEICDNIMSVARQWGSLYISIDIDAVDPAYAPATGCPVPGGMSSRELFYFVQRLRNLENLKMWDLVEINPKLDKTGATVKLGAKLLREML